ncbi:hypothetical protein BKP37_18485 [Anaerobacillus alkalilacustris]|uniref:IDEAL domain-containing protein n=1 Tax=Anaerobacillus alkalilacustris TaxID=393763 RepID=A0A1S2LDE4_9BACI|nr:IDEAL domain-containing protein [Anaerobacillus alkalilacustris]OIJ10522.1 hypothetical protein BKP37_18485 [Anaerobacillus alkalilacustris]
MEKFMINKKMLRKLSLMNNHREPSVEILDSLYAQVFLEVSIYRFQTSKLQKEIDHALKKGNKEEFGKLAEKYNEILFKYKDGIKFSKKGFELTIELEEYDL